MSNDFDLKCQKLEFFQSDQNILIFWNQCMLLVWKLTKYKIEKFSFYFPWRYRNHYWPVNVSCRCPDNKYLHPLIPKKWNVLKNWRFGMWLNHCHENEKTRWKLSSKKAPKISLMKYSSKQNIFQSDNVEQILSRLDKLSCKFIFLPLLIF